MKIISNKRGQSLVEVTVALSILAVVLTGVVTLIVNAVGLMLDSRDKTEAVAYAQQYLEEKKGSKTNSCIGLDDTDESPSDIAGTKYKKEVDIVGSDSIFPGAVLVTSKITWNAKNGSGRDVTVKQIMGRK
ncbi:hypothetical protein COY62_03095 [bacterium (Candidatus Howlettbacteria) CG_4_10_14_0_8_um_filter_40_9]|nr:MAG: hypothetical protein COY62_03095 [bacterium (Candidatus Howlettbacteria) CG_4_10_14_0_8_um_filter_40_9]